MPSLRLILVLLPLPLTAAAEDGVYRWTDEQGQVHYTNDVGSPPGDTVLTPVEGGDVSVVGASGEASKQSSKPASKEELELIKLAAEIRKADAEADLAQVATSRVYVEAELTWRASFRDARRKIQTLSDALERERAVLEKSGLPVTGQYFIPARGCHHPYACGLPAVEFEQVKLRIQQLERQLAEAKEELEELERRASHAAVPREWRR